MEQQGKKKEWVTPELLVLVRSHMEEAVLTACKFTAEIGASLINASCNVTDCSTPCDAFAIS